MIRKKEAFGYETREKEKFVFRFHRLCAGCGRQRGWSWKHLEISVSGSKRRRRFVSGIVSDTGTDLWFHTADNGSSNRQKDKAKSADGIWKNSCKMEAAWNCSMSCTGYYYAVLLCDWRMGSKISDRFSDR